jgi:Ca-activated chloride channel homolog
MTFVHPWLLVCVIAPIAWIAWSWRSSTRHVNVTLKGLSFAAILVALAEPSITMPETKTGAVVLVDTSGSITRDDLARASSIITDMEKHKRGNWMKVVPFASETRGLLPEEVSGGLRLVATANKTGSGTNLEAALTSSMSAIPSGHIPRLVLISDGNENEGSAVRAIAELERLHVPVDTIPLAGRSNTGLHLESISIPRQAYAGEQIPIDATIDSPKETHATVEIFAEGKSLGVTQIELGKGINRVRVHARVNSSGVTSISGRIAAGALGELSFEQGIQLRRGKVLYVSQDPAGTEANLLAALQQADFDVTRDVTLIDKDLSTIQLVVLNNLDLNVFSMAQKSRLEEYVKDGGGLLLIAGVLRLRPVSVRASPGG